MQVYCFKKGKFGIRLTSMRFEVMRHAGTKNTSVKSRKIL